MSEIVRLNRAAEIDRMEETAPALRERMLRNPELRLATIRAASASTPLLFEEAGRLEQVAQLSAHWFSKHMENPNNGQEHA